MSHIHSQSFISDYSYDIDHITGIQMAVEKKKPVEQILRISKQKPITDLRRTLYSRFMTPIHYYLNQLEREIQQDADMNKLGITSLNMKAPNHSHWGLGLIPFNIEDVFKSLSMTVPEDDDILSINGFIGFYPCVPSIVSGEIKSFKSQGGAPDISYMFCILVETEKYVYECKPPVVFYDYTYNEYKNAYPDDMPHYHRFIDNGHTQMNNNKKNQNTTFRCPYKLDVPNGKSYYRVYNTFTPYQVKQYPKTDSADFSSFKPTVRIHPLNHNTTFKQLEEFLNQDYTELQEMRKKAGIAISRTVIVYD